MDVQIKILDREGAHVRYLWWDEQGVEHQEDRDAFDEQVIARRRKVSLEVVLAEKHGARLAKERAVRVVPVKADAPVVKDHTHEEIVNPTIPEHGHEYASKDHPHDYANHADISLLGFKLEQNSLEEAAAREAINRRLDEHEVSHSFAPLNHSHPAIEQRLDNLEILVTAIGEQVKRLSEAKYAPEKHGHGEMIVLEQAVAQLRRQLSDLDYQIEAQANKVAAHDHDRDYAPKHNHDGFAMQADLEAHIEESKRRTNARILSTEEVGGKKRIILEEEG